MKHPTAPFNERSLPELARIVDKAEQVKQRMMERQQRLRPARIARAIDQLHKQESPWNSVDMLPRNRVAELKAKAERQVGRKERQELAKLAAARENLLRKASQQQAKSAGLERPATVQAKIERAKQQRQERSMKRDFNRVRE